MDLRSLISAILHNPSQSKRARVERGEALTMPERYDTARDIMRRFEARVNAPLIRKDWPRITTTEYALGVQAMRSRRAHLHQPRGAFPANVGLDL